MAMKLADAQALAAANAHDGFPACRKRCGLWFLVCGDGGGVGVSATGVGMCAWVDVQHTASDCKGCKSYSLTPQGPTHLFP